MERASSLETQILPSGVDELLVSILVMVVPWSTLRTRDDGSTSPGWKAPLTGWMAKHVVGRLVFRRIVCAANASVTPTPVGVRTLTVRVSKAERTPPAARRINVDVPALP